MTISGIKASTETVSLDQNDARIIAPINEREILSPPRPHGLADYNLSAFPMLAKDVDMELDIHFDITGNSITEGKMYDILSCFNNRLETIRKMLIDSRILPYKRPTRVAEVTGNKSRYRSDGCTMIGLVSEPRHDKRGSLRFTLEDETGQIECVLYNRDESKEHPLNSGLMPDDVIGVTGILKQERGKRDVFDVEDIHFPPLNHHEKSIICTPFDCNSISSGCSAKQGLHHDAKKLTI